MYNDAITKKTPKLSLLPPNQHYITNLNKHIP